MNELIEALKEHRWTAVKCAKELNISRSAWYQKLRCEIRFNAEEIKKLSKLSKLPRRKIKKIIDNTCTKV
jgi:phenylacetate-coenzyme A ligase PaaK-like adenylate-forming protein